MTRCRSTRVLWPTAVRFCSRQHLAWLAAAMVFACPLLRASAYELGYDYGSGYTWLVADGLATGALVAIFCRHPGIQRRDVLRLSLACTAAGLLMFAAGLPFGILLSRTLCGGSLRVTMLNLLFAGVLTGTLLIGTSSFRALVRVPILRLFGEISYGLYLIHMLMFDVFDHFAVRYFPNISDLGSQGHFGWIVARFVIAGSISTAVALVSRRTMEEKFLSLKDRWTANKPESVGLQNKSAAMVA